MKKLLFGFLFIVSSLLVSSQDDIIPDAPNPPKLVNNFSKEFPDFLSSAEQQQLENKLVAFDKSTSNQIVIVIVDDFGGLASYEYASKLGNKWGVGQEKFKNGVVVLVKPTGGAGEREVFITAAGGLQGAIPDAATNQIVQNEILPEFKNGNIYAGLDKATDVLMSLAKSEYNYSDYLKSSEGNPSATPPVILLIIFLVVMVLLWKKRGPFSRGYTIGRGGRYHGGWGSGSWGGGGFGGFSGGGGGGFGGFGGGGGFNGGGSGGKW